MMFSAKLKPFILVIANVAGAGILQKGLSGGDRIAVECIKYWKKKGINVTVMTSKSGHLIYGLKDARYMMIPTPTFQKYSVLGIVIFTFVALINGVKKALLFRNLDANTVVYSASDFWPDSIPAWVLKMRFRKVKWVAAFYFFAPAPFKISQDEEYRGGRMSFSLKNLAYYISQRVSYWLIRRYADFVIVSNELDKKIFVKDGVSPTKVKPIYGGVDIKGISTIPLQAPRYDGCFVGRLHPQKGPLELIMIWDVVCKARPEARLAVIGSGELEDQVRNEVRKRNLEQNVDILGFVDGKEKYKILKSSKVFLHTAILDTGGMAAAEGMACGLPVVGFDLPGYKFCYPIGMLKAPTGNIKAFAKLVLNLLQDEDLYYQVKNDALEFVQEWDWDKRAGKLLEAIKGLFGEKNEPS